MYSLSRPHPRLPSSAAPRPVQLPAAERYSHADWLEDWLPGAEGKEDRHCDSCLDRRCEIGEIEEAEDERSASVRAEESAESASTFNKAPLGELLDDDISTGEGELPPDSKSFERLLLEIAAEHRRALEKQKSQMDKQLRASVRAAQELFERERTPGNRLALPQEDEDNAGLGPKQKTVRLSPFDFASESDLPPTTPSAGEKFKQVASMLRADARNLWWRKCGGKLFDSISSCAIILNSVMIGWAANFMVTSAAEGAQPDEIASPFDIGTVAFTCWFLLEICIRMSTSGLRDYFFGEGRLWNIFDFLVVGGDVFQSALEITHDSEGSIAMQNLTVVRLLRILRITRALRILRLVRFFRELRMMVFSVLRSGSSLLWSLVLLSVTIYGFAVYFIQITAYHLHAATVVSPDELSTTEADLVQLRKMFGNILRAEYTLYLAVSGGISWGEIARLLIEIDLLHGVVFCFYTFFTTFALLNIITGIFVETSISSARCSQEELAQEQLYMTRGLMEEMKKFFQDADKDKSGTINLAEFEVYLESREVRAYLDALGIEIDKAKVLFNLLDLDSSGEISIDEFTFGCLRLKGGAKSVDLATLMNHSRRMADQWRGFFRFAEGQFQQLSDFELRLEQRLGGLLDLAGELPARTTGPPEQLSCFDSSRSCGH